MTIAKLTISCPRGVGEQISEYLLESPFLPEGFTTLNSNGHGADFVQASLREKVRGRVDAMLIIAVLPAADVAPLLEALRAQFHNRQIRYWTEPVLAFGDFA